MKLEALNQAQPKNAVPFGNILVVEDEPDTAEVIRLFLTDEGYHVRCVPTRDAARVVLNSYLYDVIVMDYMMPGMRAAEFIRETRRRCPRSKFVLITAETVAAERADVLGISRWLGKPFTPEQLVQTLRYYH
jgi:DNA-binding response OmpR family regulator